MKLNMKNFDKEKAVALLVAHVEKIVFGVFVLVFLLLCFGALSQKPYEKTPKDFTDVTSTVNSLLANSKFNPADPQNEMPVIKPLPTAKDVPEQMFLTAKAWSLPPIDVKKRRPEPTYFPLVDVRVASGYGAVQVHEAGGVGGAGNVQPPAGGGRFGAPGANPMLPGNLGSGRFAPSAPGGKFAQPAPGGRFGAPPAGKSAGVTGKMAAGAKGAGGASKFDNDRGGVSGRFAGPMGGVAAGGSTKGMQWVVVTGLVPVAAQEKEYRNAFREARHTSPQLDTPEYLWFAVERAEVVPGSASEKEPKFAPIDVEASFTIADTFSGALPDPVDPLRIEPALCQPLPPVVGRDLDAASVGHPKLPPRDPNSGMFGQAPAMGGGMMRGGDMPMRAGAGAAFRPGMAAPRVAANPMVGGIRGEGQGRFGMRNPMAGPGAAANQMAVNAPPPIDYKLFRFFDYKVEPGKSYKYRVKLLLHNPNEGVPSQYLARAEQAKGQTRETPWSDSSPMVSVSRGFNIMVGGIKKASGLTDAKAEVVLRKWDAKEAVEAVRTTEINKGQVVNLPTDKAVVMPNEQSNFPMGQGAPPQETEIAFHTDTLILDMTGGDRLSGVRGQSPTRLLVLEPDGQLSVKSELVDIERYASARSRIKEAADANRPPPSSDEESDKPKRRGAKDDAAGTKGGLDALKGNATGKSKSRDK